MNCKDCKHKNTDRRQINSWHGDDDQYICNKLSILSCLMKTKYNHLAHTWDTDDYLSVLLVRDEFGCVEFEKSSTKEG